MINLYHLIGDDFLRFQTTHGEISVNVATRAHLEDVVREKFSQNQGFALSTLNLDHLTKMNENFGFLQTYIAQDFVVADGNPIVWMSHLQGKAIDLLPGSELVIPLAQLAQSCGKSIALLGSTDDALQQAASHLQGVVPGLEVVCLISPPFGFDPQGDDAAEMLKQVQASGASLCFIALGAPKQEELAARGGEFAPSVGFASIGAGLDFLAGTQVRAPKWVQQIAMEWLWRLLQNPKRMWRRYAACFAILPGHIWRSWKLR